MEIVAAGARDHVDPTCVGNTGRKVEVHGRDLELLHHFLREAHLRASNAHGRDAASIHHELGSAYAPVRFSMSPCESFLRSRRTRTRSPMITALISSVSPTSAVRRINTFVCNGSTPESSLHLGHFQRVGEVQIQVLQQDRLMLGGSTDATLSDRHSVSRR